MRDRPRPRITRQQIAEIRRLRGEGFKLREIAARLGVSINSVCRHGKPARSYPRLADPHIQPLVAFIAPPSRTRLMAGR